MSNVIAAPVIPLFELDGSKVKGRDEVGGRVLSYAESRAMRSGASHSRHISIDGGNFTMYSLGHINMAVYWEVGNWMRDNGRPSWGLLGSYVYQTHYCDANGNLIAVGNYVEE